MAIAAATCWEVRATNGNDTNGGGFVAGATGTDYSQQNAKNTGANDTSTTDGVGNGTTTFTSATANFGTTIVGNIIYLQGGTGSLAAGWYQVTARASAVSITLDRTVAAGTGITVNIGGALATINQLSTNMIASNIGYIKAEATYTTTATITFATSNAPSASTPRTIIRGYTTTRSDNGYATLQLTTNTGLTGIASTAQGFAAYNIIVDCNSLGTSVGISNTSATTLFYNCKVMNFTSKGFAVSASAVIACEVTLGTSAASGGIVNAGAGTVIYDCYIHDNACPGVSNGNFLMCSIRNVIANNTGASSDGYITTAGGVPEVIFNNTIYGNGRHGIFFNASAGSGRYVLDNVLSNNGGFGFQGGNAAGIAASINFDGNAYFNNTSGTRNNMDDTTVNKQNNVTPYTNVFDQTCTTSPFTNAAGADWTLNQTSTGGAKCRSQGVPQSFTPALSGNRPWIDMGAIQHQDPGFSAG